MTDTLNSIIDDNLREKMLRQLTGTTKQIETTVRQLLQQRQTRSSILHIPTKSPEQLRKEEREIRRSEPLRDLQHQVDRLEYRLHVHSACDRCRTDPWQDNKQVRFRARRAYWNACVESGLEVCENKPKDLKDLQSRLREKEWPYFWQALSECKVAFALHSAGLKVRRGNKNVHGRTPEYEFDHQGTTYFVEVKAPQHDYPSSWSPKTNQIFKKQLEAANSQFERENRNILFVVPNILYEDFFNYEGIERIHDAFIASSHLQITYDSKTSERVSTKQVPKYDGGFMAKNTRISAVVILEDKDMLPSPAESPQVVEQKFIVAHNPRAIRRISPELFGNWPQFAPIDGHTFNWINLHRIDETRPT